MIKQNRLWMTLALLFLLLSACANMPGSDPLKVNVVGVEALEGQGLELRLAVKLRVQNPNDRPVEYDGVSVDLAVRGNDLASGVSPERGTVPRYGEAVIVVPVTITPMAMLVQAYGLTRADNRRIGYALRGKLAGTGFGGVRFESSGEFEIPIGAEAASTR